WSFTTEAGATTECRLGDGSSIVTDYAPCTGSATYDLTGQPDGDYQFSVRATDGVGNTGAPAASTYTLDTSGPGGTITSRPPSPGCARSPTWSFSTDAGSTTQCTLTGPGGIISGPSACSDSAAYNISGRPVGDYVFSVVATDQAGNTGSPATDSYTLDT